ncbi:hypothetical protein K1719_015942 [Acacia pycnantha]|nr:hypothetical protein K1719_015942 [Acacia pycnantha]
MIPATYFQIPVAAKKLTLKNVTDYIVDVICKRAQVNYNYGVILIPEGLIDFIPEVQQLIAELNEILAHDIVDEGGLWKKKLTDQSLKLFEFLPQAIQEQLMLERDPHGNVQVAKIETEKMLIQMVETELEKRKQEGTYKAVIQDKFPGTHSVWNNMRRTAAGIQETWLCVEDFNDVVAAEEKLGRLPVDVGRMLNFQSTEVEIILKRIEAWDGEEKSWWQREVEIILKRIEAWDGEEKSWWQRSRVGWLKDGNRNTRFFHSSTIRRKLENKVVKLGRDDGDLIKDGKWNLDGIKSVLNEDELNSIESVRVPLNDVGDRLVWLGSRDGEDSVKMGYKMASREEEKGQ